MKRLDLGSGVAMAAGGALVAAQVEKLSGAAFALLMLAAAALAALGAVTAGRFRIMRGSPGKRAGFP